MNLRTLGILALAATLLWVVAAPRAAAESKAGKIDGTVLDPVGVPQMGATVVITAQSFFASTTLQMRTNEHGRFSTPELRPGTYSVRAMLAGFLPTLEPDVHVKDSGTTTLQIQLGSIFSGLTSVLRQTNQRPANGDWAWVLRSAPSTRPVLRLDDGDLVLVDGDEPSESVPAAESHQARSRIDVISGARPGALNSFSDTPGTSFAYDQGIGATGRLLLAGQFSYESQTPSGGFATLWLPDGDTKSGPATSLMLRQSRLGPTGPMFRAMRMDQDGSFAVTDGVTLRYGAEYLLAGLGNQTTTGVRPRAEVAFQISPAWEASVLLASRPVPEASPEATGPLDSALDSLDEFPTLMFRAGRPVLVNGWHEEFAVEHLLANHARIEFAGFHDDSDDTAVFGKGRGTNNFDFLQTFLASDFAYDAGGMSAWGARAAYQKQFSDDLSATLVYAWGGALSPIAGGGPTDTLRQALSSGYHSSVAGSMTAHVPGTGTQITTGYKWVGGSVVSRVDEFGETFFRVDPYFNLMVRQPIPWRCFRHVQAVADLGNLFAQGYVPVATRDGQIIMVSAYRTFRGGLSLQF
ncbi:MAG TPA: carboxypeptidase-like regulatory domain-containing protein [Candidatus Acidoferrales bacterium]|nr:carboxypeptidase-like regulatory domain-containing protein [Candidatus Acidoferrales bacterium]